jgi:predicted transcriptional regulator with HTH domain
MPVVSAKKKEKISEQLLHYLFSVSPIAQFTSKISEEIARDEEFTKSLLQNLHSKNLVLPILKSKSGKNYKKRLAR